MSLVRVENVQVTKPVAKFNDELEFVISFECLAPGLEEELEWKVIYVGSPDDVRFDQELECVLVGPVAIGKNKFVLTAPPPDPSKIPEEDLFEVTVLLITCSYRGQEFIRIGYYVDTYVEGKLDEHLQRRRKEEEMADAEEIGDDDKADEDADRVEGGDEDGEEEDAGADEEEGDQEEGNEQQQQQQQQGASASASGGLPPAKLQGSGGAGSQADVAAKPKPQRRERARKLPSGPVDTANLVREFSSKPPTVVRKAIDWTPRAAAAPFAAVPASPAPPPAMVDE